MTTYSFDSTNAALMLTDTPVGYHPPVGPAIEFTANYSSLEPSDQSFVTNLGLGWSSQWLSYLHVAQNQPSGTIVCFGPGGGELEFLGYNSATGAYNPQLLSHDILVKNSSSSYTLSHADGSFDTYDLSDNSSTPNIFRTSSTDRFGNKLLYGYDSNLRLVSVTDAIGQVTSLQYGLSTDSTKGDFYRITKVTDPFGRSASFTYSNGELTSITDVLGIQSSYTYGGASGFVTALTTPYGTTSFAKYGDGVHTIGIQAKDPLGGQERLEYDVALDPPVLDIVDTYLYAAPSNLVPSGFTNGNLSYRNTFFWSKKAMLEGPGDFNKAFVYHWLHDAASGNTQMGYVIESTKAPLENRVWRAYPGQPDTLHEGISNLPSRIARILDDGSEQDSYAKYNSLGNLTQSVDPLGRTTTYTYASNQIDLLSVTVANGSGQDLLASYTYNSQHLPLTATDAAGQTTTYTYNSFGELLTVTNAKNETTTLAYDSRGYLQQITGPVAGATTSFTYDGFGRVATVTDAEGYTVATNYDAADRSTKVTFPDGTYTQTIYNRLDPEWSQDRLGRWTLTEYDALRHLVLVEDPLQRKTLFEHCTCGALIGMTDPNGSRTTLTRDLQQRITQKTFADGTSISMVYESTTSRLKSRTDQKGQTTVYSYNRDDSLAGVSYPNAQVATPGVTYAYDPAYPRIASMTDGVGTTTYSYNPVTGSSSLGAGQLASVSGPLPSSTVSYTYDPLGRVLTTSINGSANITSAEYDSLGRVTSVSNPLGQFAYTYVDQTARVRSLSYPNGQVTNFQYYGNASSDGSGNGDQRLQTIQNLNSSGTNLSTFSYTYDSNGQITTWGKQWDSGSAASSSFGYDAASQLVSAYVRNPSTLATQGLFYSYDPAGNRTQEQIDSTINTSSYNSVNEYTAQAAGGSMTFAGSVSEPATVKVGGNTAMVDSSNNWSGSAAVTTGSNSILLVATDSQGNSTTKTITVSVSGGPSRTLTYDPNGNLLNNGAGQTYQWDAENRLESISQASGVTGFVYDGSGHRVQETLNGQVTKQWVWCGSQPCEERDASSSVTKRFYAQGEQVSGVSYFYSKDHLGSIRELTDGTGAIRARYDYDPFGRVTKVAGDIDADFGFTGDYFHKASGLSLTLYRAYDPNLGRWLAHDPIGENGGLNLYGYCANDPINAVDHDGRFLNFVAGFVVGAGIDAASQLIANHGDFQHLNGWSILLAGGMGATGVGLASVAEEAAARIAISEAGQFATRAVLNAGAGAMLGYADAKIRNAAAGCERYDAGRAALLGAAGGAFGSVAGDLLQMKINQALSPQVGKLAGGLIDSGVLSSEIAAPISRVPGALANATSSTMIGAGIVTASEAADEDE